MATIQVRDVSEESYEIIRGRARRAGMSIQAYMRQEIERLAQQPTDAELFDQMQRIASESGATIEDDALFAALDSDRR